MSKYSDLSIKEIHELLKNKEIKPIDLVRETFEKIEEEIYNQNKGKELKQLQKHEMFCLAVSGTLWGFSNVFYYYAAKVGILSVVVPIDRMSVLISVAFGILIYKEKMTFRSTTGLVVMILGTLLIAICG